MSFNMGTHAVSLHCEEQTPPHIDERNLHPSTNKSRSATFRDNQSLGSPPLYYQQPYHQKRAYQRTNIESFLFYTTPAVPCQHAAKIASWHSTNKIPRSCSYGIERSVPFFSLSQIWDAYEEWSMYGCGVPISLGAHETVTQYYVPYLSAMQLYARSKTAVEETLRFSLDEHSPGAAWSTSSSSAMEYRDSSSETSEGDDRSLRGCGASESSSEPGSDASSLTDEDVEAGGGAGLGLGGHRGVNSWKGRCQDCKLKDKVFEYFEHALPYSRVPLVHKIEELGIAFPNLRQLRSVDLHPASWFSVAWYPVYRIPTGPTLRDLGASFLTYHCLSTPLTSGIEEQCLHCSKMYWISPRLPSIVSTPPFPTRESASPTMQLLQLLPFGLAYHKLKVPLWDQPRSDLTNREDVANKRRIWYLQSQPDRWLREQNVYHPDYEFFKNNSQGGPKRF